LFRFPFDLATRPGHADDLVLSATASEYNIDAIHALTSMGIAKELSLMKKELRLHPLVDLHYEPLMYCMCNPAAFGRLLTARNLRLWRQNGSRNLCSDGLQSAVRGMVPAK